MLCGQSQRTLSTPLSGAMHKIANPLFEQGAVGIAVYRFGRREEFFEHDRTSSQNEYQSETSNGLCGVQSTQRRNSNGSPRSTQHLCEEHIKGRPIHIGVLQAEPHSAPVPVPAIAHYGVLAVVQQFAQLLPVRL